MTRQRGRLGREITMSSERNDARRTPSLAQDLEVADADAIEQVSPLDAPPWAAPRASDIEAPRSMPPSRRPDSPRACAARRHAGWVSKSDDPGRRHVATTSSGVIDSSLKIEERIAIRTCLHVHASDKVR